APDVTGTDSTPIDSPPPLVTLPETDASTRPDPSNAPDWAASDPTAPIDDTPTGTIADVDMNTPDNAGDTGTGTDDGADALPQPAFADAPDPTADTATFASDSSFDLTSGAPA